MIYRILELNDVPSWNKNGKVNPTNYQGGRGSLPAIALNPLFRKEADITRFSWQICNIKDFTLLSSGYVFLAHVKMALSPELKTSNKQQT